MGRLTEKTRTNITMVICFMIYTAIIVVQIHNERHGLSEYNGILMACNFGVCIYMVLKDYRKGWINSVILMSVSLFMMVRAIFVNDAMITFTGVANLMFYLVTLFVLSRQFKIREIEARTDILTGLYNRRGLYKIIRRKSENREPFSVVYIDLGNFKFINDNYGHVFGDRVMTIVSKRLTDTVGKAGLVTRIGGDEFVILLDDELQPEELANKMLNKVRERMEIHTENGRVDCYLDAWAGISIYPRDSVNYEELIKFADIAMYHATKDKSDRAYRFDKNMADILARQLELEHLVKEGIEKNYFYMVYQPQYSMKEKKLRGFEALIRMRTPEGKNVSPGEFIPIAEGSDLIMKIDSMVLEMTLKEFKPVVQNLNQEVTVSVNVSAKNIASPDFVEKIARVLEKTGYPAENLEIEMTEYSLAQNVDVTINNIASLRKMGVQVALDDFGTGYTSLAYLSKMPINLLKIDKTLIDDIESAGKHRDFVRAAIYMGHLMGCEVISEGVEYDNQTGILKELECDFVQGYIWGRPLPFKDAEELCRK